MPNPDLDAIEDICALYALSKPEDYPGETFAPFDLVCQPETDNGVCWAARKLPSGGTRIVFRGSVTSQDWIRDTMAMPYKVKDIGTVHHGFYLGMTEVMAGMFSQALRFPYEIGGHSLGAARASIFAAMMEAHGVPVSRRVVFGEPYPGFKDLAAALANVPGASYCNGDAYGHDLVTNVPLHMPPAFDYVRATPLIQVSASPAKRDSMFCYHHAQLYREALRKAQ